MNNLTIKATILLVVGKKMDDYISTSLGAVLFFMVIEKMIKVFKRCKSLL